MNACNHISFCHRRARVSVGGLKGSKRLFVRSPLVDVLEDQAASGAPKFSGRSHHTLVVTLDDGFVARGATLDTLVHSNHPQMARDWTFKTSPRNMLPAASPGAIGIRPTLRVLHGVQHGIPQDGVDARLIPLATAFEP